MIRGSVAQESADKVRAQAIAVRGFKLGAPIEELQVGWLTLNG